MQTIVGPIALKSLQLAFEKLGWAPPDSAGIIACLRGDTNNKGKGLDMDQSVRKKWVETLMSVESLDRKQQEAAYGKLRAEIGDWLDHYTRGEDRPQQRGAP